MAVPTLTYLTDVEGLWPRLEGFAHANPCLSLEGDRLTVAPGALLIFGGDLADRGPHGRKVLTTLVECWRRQPEQVLLLAGNRDLNKLRLLREIDRYPPHRMPADVREGPRAVRLRWIFTYTMGAPLAFEHRKAELIERGEPADDDAVVDTFLTDVQEGGLLRSFLEAAHLAARVGPTLFVHGGVTDENYIRLPDGALAESLDAWLAGLEQWYRDQLEQVWADRFESADLPPWTPLMAYQAPLPGTRMNQRSVVYGRNTDSMNNPLLPSPEVRRRLLAEGVCRVVVGHTPMGDHPTLVRSPEFEVVQADHSHSRRPEGARDVIEPNRVSVGGRVQLDDGSVHTVAFSVERGDPDNPIGFRLRSSGALVNGRLGDGRHTSFRYLPGYQVIQQTESEAVVAREALEPAESAHPGA